FEHADEVEVTWRSYELDPSAPRQRDLNGAAHLARKYGWPLEQAQAAQDRVVAAAAEEGLEYDLEGSRGGNTFDAHRLLHLAKAQGRQPELQEALMDAYFRQGVAVGEHAELADVATAAGLAREDVDRVLASDEFADAVREDEQLAARMGIQGVPYFV